MAERARKRLRGRPWKKGESGNPEGHSKGRRLSSEMKRHLADPEKRSALIDAWYKAALDGSFPHLREILERTEGKVASKMEISEKKIDWSNLDNEGDTERPTINPEGVREVPEEGEA